MSAIGELFAVLLAGLREGDLPGLLRAWWQVTAGRVRPTDRYAMTAAGRARTGR